MKERSALVSTHIPKVSIGLAVYNGAQFIGATIESIQSQTFSDFELIISDNASEDDTESICRAYAAEDPRVLYSRNSTNLGARENKNLLVRLSRGQYFKPSSHNDMLAPDFLARCVEVLDNNPALVLCFSRMKIVDENDEVVALPDSSMHFVAETAHERLSKYFASERVYQTIYGLIRNDALQKTALEGPWYGSDRALLQELALYGGFYVIDEPLFIHRQHSQRSWFALDRAAWYQPTTAGRVVPGYWMHLASSVRMVFAAPISWHERMLCFFEYLRHGTGRAKVWLPILTRESLGMLRQKLPPTRSGR